MVLVTGLPLVSAMKAAKALCASSASQIQAFRLAHLPQPSVMALAAQMISQSALAHQMNLARASLCQMMQAVLLSAPPVMMLVRRQMRGLSIFSASQIVISAMVKPQVSLALAMLGQVMLM